MMFEVFFILFNETKNSTTLLPLDPPPQIVTPLPPYHPLTACIKCKNCEINIEFSMIGCLLSILEIKTLSLLAATHLRDLYHHWKHCMQSFLRGC